MHKLHKSRAPVARPRLNDGEIIDRLSRLGSIGQFERLAGVGQSHDERYAFWAPFAAVWPPGASLDAGVEELRRRVFTRIYAGELSLI